MKTPFRFLFGLSSIFESMEFDESRKTKVVVLRLDSGAIVNTFELDSFFGFHLGNGYECGDALVFDALRVENMDVMGGLADVFAERGDDFDFLNNGARLDRFTLNLVTGAVSNMPVAGALAGEFPAWAASRTGVEHRYTWLGTIVENGTPYSFNAIQKIDHRTGELKIHDFGAGRFTSEAKFIPAFDGAPEDVGYLMSIVYNHTRKKSEIVLLDACDMQRELAVIPLQHHVPFGFHGGFYPQTFI